MDRLKKLEEDKRATAKEIERLIARLMSDYPEIKDLEIIRHSFHTPTGRIMVAQYELEISL